MDLNIKTNDKGHLDIGGADACDLVEQYGTPIYVIDEERIRDKKELETTTTDSITLSLNFILNSKYSMLVKQIQTSLF